MKKLGSIEEQSEQVLKNVQAILLAAGSDLSRVLKVTVYIADISLWDAVNCIYAQFLSENIAPCEQWCLRKNCITAS